MENFTIFDGLILTIVAMLVVFIVLAAIWGLVEVVAKIIARVEPTEALSKGGSPVQSEVFVENPKHQKAADIMALILAADDQPNKKFEIIESKRVHESGGITK